MANWVSPTPTVLLYFLAIFLPPLAVFLDSGCSVDFLINICLTILGWIPGVLHAWYVISKRERASAAADQYVTGRPPAPAPAPAPAPPPPPPPADTTGAATASAPGTTAAKY